MRVFFRMCKQNERNHQHGRRGSTNSAACWACDVGATKTSRRADGHKRNERIQFRPESEVAGRRIELRCEHFPPRTPWVKRSRDGPVTLEPRSSRCTSISRLLTLHFSFASVGVCINVSSGDDNRIVSTRWLTQ